ncbi:MAG: glycosyltransferase [Bacteroidaceae bacterium]|nr:glycosyltransferase [Bacteroidaceae bacterium]
MTPLISFIITYHNEPEAWVQACIESIQALPLAEDEREIIVVDDGKTLNYQLSIVNYQLIQQDQSGLSVARNTGISEAQGRYIQFVDADDCLVPSAYEIVLEQVRKDAADIMLFRMTTGVDKFLSSLVYKFLSSLFFKLYCIFTNSQTHNLINSQSFLLNRNLRAGACAYVFRRDILGDLRFYPNLLHEDELFTPLLFLRAGNVCELDVKAYFYRQHEGTITHSDTARKIQKRLNDIHFILKQLQSLEEPLLERRIRQLTVDFLQKTWTLTHSLRELRKRSRELRAEGFMPLPLRWYSLRYLIIASLAKAL